MLTPERFAEVAARDIAFARDLFRAVDRQFTVPAAIAEDLGIAEWSSSEEMSSLQSYIQDKGPLNPLRNEIGVLSFAEKFISHLQQGNLPEVVTPSTTQIAVQQIGKYVRVQRVIFRVAQKHPPYRHISIAPSWAAEHTRMQIKTE